ncbi:uncharacterized protein K02A2.6-like [Ylistrum balloti]|uniref:uncharacterized protein K02A2.6-like n=1 Tax=Ylistrum balloti TaxID=509963 RepID=UPI002905871F|nr:uncharacterized protein K02A2.6-like [Ylistrum balloti]
MDQLTSRDWRKLQARDRVLSPFISAVREKRKPSRQDMYPAQLSILRYFEHLVLKDGILCRQTNHEGEIALQRLIPSSKVHQVLEASHNDVGHPGRDRTLSLVKERFFWPGMLKDVENWLQKCPRCIRRKTSTVQIAPLVNITTSQPLELVCIDYLTLETSKGGYQHIFVLTDHFTRYAQAYPTRNQTAWTTAEVLFNNFFVNYGFPIRLHSDQGANFAGKVIHELCQITGIRKSRTTPYHPMGNGICERFNRTLLGMLGTLEPGQKMNWKKHVAPLVHAYNCTKNEQTGTSGNAKERQEIFDRKVKGATIECGDRVLVKKLVHEGKHKLADKWEEIVHIVQDQPNPEVPVFRVKPERGGGRLRTLHRNLLLPVGNLERTENTPEKVPARSIRRDQRRKEKLEVDNRDDRSVLGSEDDTEEDEYLIVSPPADVTGTPTSAHEDTDAGEDIETPAGEGDGPIQPGVWRW